MKFHRIYLSLAHTLVLIAPALASDGYFSIGHPIRS
jgi:hypothetical protein